jgi:protein-tyrosine phosphatase
MLDSINAYINDHYGSRRGLLRHCLFGVQNAFGQFRHLKAVDWARVERLVFVCYGNICRSPVAAEYAVQRASFPAISFGLSCRDGAPADPRAISFAGDAGVDLHGHRSRHISAYEPSVSDLVIGMEPVHLHMLDEKRGFDMVQRTLLGLWLPSSTPYIHDPYSSNPLHFVRCETAVIAAVDRLTHHVRR